MKHGNERYIQGRGNGHSTTACLYMTEASRPGSLKQVRFGLGPYVGVTYCNDQSHDRRIAKEEPSATASARNSVIRTASRGLSNITLDVGFGTDSRSRLFPC